LAPHQCAIAICEYLETLYPDSPLMGSGTEERGVSDGLLYAAIEAFRNATLGLASRAVPAHAAEPRGREILTTVKALRAHPVIPRLEFAAIASSPRR
jgi:hypothetical protein